VALRRFDLFYLIAFSDGKPDTTFPENALRRPCSWRTGSICAPRQTSRPAARGVRWPRCCADAQRCFRKQGFASVELVTRWREIVGAEIAEHSQPEKIQWPRGAQDAGAPEPGTLLLRVEGPTALEIQHLSGVILERVNRFFGWQAVAGVRLRQAPLSRTAERGRPRPLRIPPPWRASPPICPRSRTRNYAVRWLVSAPPSDASERNAPAGATKRSDCDMTALEAWLGA
jgi:hypothetical protein